MEVDAHTHVKYLKKTLDVTRKINQMLVVEKDPEELINKACNILVDIKKYYFSWIILFDKDLNITSIRSAGCAIGFDALKESILLGNLPEPLEKKDLVVCDKPQHNCPLKLSNSQWSSFIAPLQIDDQIHGLICSAVPNEYAHNQVERETYIDITNNIGFALSGLKEQQGLRIIFNETPEGFVTLRKTFDIVDVNPAFCKIVKSTKDELVGKNMFQLLKKFAFYAEQSDFTELINKLYLGADLKQFELRYCNKVYSITANLKTFSKYIFASVRDVTHEKFEQDLVIKSESKYRSLVNSLNDSLFILQDGVIKFVNPNLCKVSGYSEEELVGNDFTLFIAPEEVNKIISIHNKRLNGSSVNSYYESVATTKTGAKVPVDVNVIPTEYEDRPALQVLLKDISDYVDRNKQLQLEKNRAEESRKKLYDSEKLVSTLIQSMPSGFLMIGEDYKIYRVNDQTCKITGYSKEELEGAYCDIICPKGSKSKECPVWEKGVDSFSGMDTSVKCCDGFNTPVLKNAQTITIDGKRYILESFQDITNLKNTEKELIYAKEKAEESDRLKTAFLANMSHEIRTPIHGILGFADLLKASEIEDKEQQTYVNIIHSSGERMLSTINDIIDISKIESGSTELFMRPLKLSDFINHLYMFFAPQAQSKGIDLLVDIKEEDRIKRMVTDEDKLNSIVTNLLRNAIKFTEQGQIVFGYKKLENSIEFYVSDTGRGIQENHQEAIFQRFMQADNTYSREFEGSGLGLAISKSFAEMLGGSIYLESELGKGSTFFVRLPYKG